MRIKQNRRKGRGWREEIKGWKVYKTSALLTKVKNVKMNEVWRYYRKKDETPDIRDTGIRRRDWAYFVISVLHHSEQLFCFAWNPYLYKYESSNSYVLAQLHRYLLSQVFEVFDRDTTDTSDSSNGVSKRLVSKWLVSIAAFLSSFQIFTYLIKSEWNTH